MLTVVGSNIIYIVSIKMFELLFTSYLLLIKLHNEYQGGEG